MPCTPLVSLLRTAATTLAVATGGRLARVGLRVLAGPWIGPRTAFCGDASPDGPGWLSASAAVSRAAA